LLLRDSCIFEAARLHATSLELQSSADGGVAYHIDWDILENRGYAANTIRDAVRWGSTQPQIDMFAPGYVIHCESA